MGRAAYCSECSGYVWVSAEGGCGNGHARSFLRDVHESAELPTPVGIPPVPQNPGLPVDVPPAAAAPITMSPVDGFAAQPDPLTGAANQPSGYYMPPPAPVNETNTRNIGVRIAAYLIDFVIIAVTQAITGFAAGFVVALSAIASGGNPETATASTAVTVGLYFIGATIFLSYFIITEAALGYTLGKKLFGLRVVNAAGEPISWGQSVGRNLMRIVDLLFWGLVGIVSMNGSALRQRLGDRVAHTYVIR